MFWEIVYNKCDNYCILNFIYLISVIFLRDVTEIKKKKMERKEMEGDGEGGTLVEGWINPR